MLGFFNWQKIRFSQRCPRKVPSWRTFRHRKPHRREEQQPDDAVRVADAAQDPGRRPRHPVVPGAQLYLCSHRAGLRFLPKTRVSPGVVVG
jgi:hypothetical protein